MPQARLRATCVIIAAENRAAFLPWLSRRTQPSGRPASRGAYSAAAGSQPIRYNRAMSESRPDSAPAGGGVRSRLQAALRTAMKAQDTVAVSALRSALAAIANAEAIPVPGAAVPP